MSVTASRKLADIAELIGAGQDPRKVLIREIGEDNIAEFEPAYDDVLVATYVRSDKTKGGVIIGGDRTRQADRFEGRVALVLKLGKNVDTEKFPGPFNTPLKIGDWVIINPSNGREHFFVDKKTNLDGSSVRIISQFHIEGRVKDPASVY